MHGSYHFGEFELNLDLRVLVREGQRVALGSKAYDVLTCLVSHAGSVVSKADLLKHVWPESFVEEGTLTQHIFSLRKALGDKADCIVTVPGHGYRFAGTVRHTLVASSQTWTPDSGVEIVREVRERTHVVVEEPILMVPTKSRPPAGPLWLYALVGIAIAAAIAGWLWSRRTVPHDYVGVVVADFVNTTGDATFDRTLRRALEIDLGQSPFMGVMSDAEGVTTLGLMGLKPDTTLTSPVALEICERTNRQALLTGTISSVGQRYLLTLEATDCHTGKRIDSVKATADSKEKVLDALDTIAERNRSKLGESASSLKNYEVPIADGATPSLEALKAYSMGIYMLNQGKIDKEAAPFFLKAIELDPHFAQAYGELSAAYYNMEEPQLAGEYMQKLCAMNARVGERTQLAIDSHCEKDIFASIKVYRMWSDQYPHDWVPWLDLANLYNQLGQPETALPAAQRALKESNGNQICYDVLIRALKDSQHFAEAKATAAEALQHGKDAGPIHNDLYEIAVFEHNAADLARETQWYEANKAGAYYYFMAQSAAMEGKYALAEDLFQKELAEDKHQQETEYADSVLIDKATTERQMGLLQVARATLAQVSRQTRVRPDLAVEHALEGDVAFADQFLAAQKDPAKAAADITFVPYMMGPQIQAAKAMHNGKPQDAITALEQARPMELADYSTPTQRGEDSLKAGQAKLAETQYREILSHPGINLGVEFTLAHLGLARALAMEGDTAGSRKEYEAFLVAWKDADPNVPALLAAKSELAKLR